MGLSPSQAKEIAQETWLRLLKQQRSGKLTRLVLPALAIKQARFLALDASRRKRPGSPPTQEQLAATPDPRPSLEDELAGKRRLRRALTALERCGKRTQLVFELVYGSRALTLRQAADEAGISYQRAKQSLSEARARMRKELEKDHG